MTDADVRALLTRFLAAFGTKFGHGPAIAPAMESEWRRGLEGQTVADVTEAANQWIDRETGWPPVARIREMANAIARERAHKEARRQDAHPDPFCRICGSFDLYENGYGRLRVLHIAGCALGMPDEQRFDVPIAVEGGKIWRGGRAPRSARGGGA